MLGNLTTGPSEMLALYIYMCVRACMYVKMFVVCMHVAYVNNRILNTARFLTLQKRCKAVAVIYSTVHDLP